MSRANQRRQFRTLKRACGSTRVKLPVSRWETWVRATGYRARLIRQSDYSGRRRRKSRDFLVSPRAGGSARAQGRYRRGKNGDCRRRSKLKPEINSIAAWRAWMASTGLDHPQFLALRGKKRVIPAFAAPVFPRNDRARPRQAGCGCISKPAGRPARRAASAGGNAGSQRLASKRQPLTVSASRETT